MANDFISYAGIITSVFNSVAARFIANSYYKKDFDKANNYFNSLIVTNFGLAGVFGVLGVILVPNLNQVISVPIDILVDVKITFALTFLSYCITLITMVFTTSTFVANRTDLQGIRDIIKHIVRFSLIIVFLNFVSIKLYWTSAALLIATAVVAVLNVSLTRKLTPELKFSLKMANVKYASELAKSGCWMAMTSISTILLRGLDLTIANIMLGEYEMGILSIARTFPNNFTSVISTIAPVFTPVFLSYYAKKNLSELKNQVEQSINMMALIMFVPISGFIVFSQDFYGLWQRSLTPTEINMVAALSSITVIQAYFNSTPKHSNCSSTHRLPPPTPNAGEFPSELKKRKYLLMGSYCLWEVNLLSTVRTAVHSLPYRTKSIRLPHSLVEFRHNEPLLPGRSTVRHFYK